MIQKLMQKNQEKGYRLDNTNINDYVKEICGTVSGREQVMVTGFIPLLQKDYGKPYDCTLTCITAILSRGKDVEKVYEKVEKVAEKHLYDGDSHGTIPVFIKAIIDKVANVDSKRGYGKGIGYNWEVIKTIIRTNKPIVLSMQNDGRNYYKNHSVTIVGFREYNNGEAKLLVIYDNWKKSVSYVDYDKLSVISSINYF